MNRTMPITVLLLMVVCWCVPTQGADKKGAFAQEAELTDSNASAFAELGFSVSTNGNTVAATTGGAVDIYVEPTGGWADLTAPTAQLTVSGDSLNYVCISGNVIAATGLSGVAYVYVMPTGGWGNSSQPNAVLTASDQAVFTNVAISGNLVVAASPTADGAQSQTGAAYAFVMPVSGWTNMTETAKLTASDGVTDDRFGVSVSVSAATVLIGAPDATVGGSCPKQCLLFQGAAYVFVKPDQGWVTMTQTAKLYTRDGGPGDNFGGSVSVNDNGATVLIGASQQDTVTRPGAAYIFSRPGATWKNSSQYTAKLTASNGEKFGWFGFSVALSGSSTKTALVSSVDGFVGSNLSQGAVYVFVEPSGGWKTAKQTAIIKASDGTVGDVFGQSVAVNGSTIAVGAPYHAVGSNKGQGAAYIF